MPARKRVLFALVGLLFAASSSVVAVIDATAERRPAPAHIDTPNTPHKDVAHLDDCALCRHLVSSYGVFVTRYGRPDARVVTPGVARLQDSHAAAELDLAASPRAPPAS